MKAAGKQGMKAYTSHLQVFSEEEFAWYEKSLTRKKEEQNSTKALLSLQRRATLIRRFEIEGV